MIQGLATAALSDGLPTETTAIRYTVGGARRTPEPKRKLIIRNWDAA